ADFHSTMVQLKVGDVMAMKHLMYRLVEILYTRVNGDLEPSTFRLTGDTITIRSSIGNHCYRVTFFDDEIEDISLIDAESGQRLDSLDKVNIYPANLFVPSKQRVEQAVLNIEADLETQIEFFTKEGREMEAKRIEQRVNYDLEMIRELGYCSGIENYSRYFDGRSPGMRPFCLLDYFPEDSLFIIDESHVTVPQVRGMFGGDRSRKENLVEYGFRLPAARDNRPLRFEEFESLQGQTIYVSATPAPYELMRSENSVIEQFIRPTGIIDPALRVCDATHQIDRLMEDIDECVKRGGKMIVTTISKRMCEEVSAYLEKMGVRSRYIHSDLDTLERVQIIEDMIKNLVIEVDNLMKDAGIKSRVYGRMKHIFSIYKKMINQNKEFDQILDLFAVRIIVDSVKDCYAALGIIHEHYKPIQGRFKDYIAMPKSNMYQSLHTTLIGPNGQPFEIQIRTEEMHKTAENGIAAHWKYKEDPNGKHTPDKEEEKLSWLREILEWQNNLSDNKEFLSVIKSDFNLFTEDVYCFTPSGDVKNLPNGSTPIDFAYSIHSAVGNKMVGARVNGKIVNIDYKIQNGDRIEIITSQNSKGPSRDWLNIVKSSQAKNKINQWFKSEFKEDNIVKGRELIERYCK
ncbi:MAG: TGS domain-containing protein, partial [Alistipes sp.]|nr:TGS domain-containing protein [Alistipes sp.]